MEFFYYHGNWYFLNFFYHYLYYLLWILLTTNVFCIVFPQSPNEVYSFMRSSPITEGRGPDMFFGSSKQTGPAKRVNCVCLLSANQVVRALPPSQVPLTEIYPKGKTLTHSYVHIYKCISKYNGALLMMVVLIYRQMSHLPWLLLTWKWQTWTLKSSNTFQCRGTESDSFIKL